MRTIVGTATTLLGPHMTDYAAETDELFVATPGQEMVVVFSAFGTATGNLAPEQDIGGTGHGDWILSPAPAYLGTATGVLLDLTR